MEYTHTAQCELTLQRVKARLKKGDIGSVERSNLIVLIDQTLMDVCDVCQKIYGNGNACDCDTGDKKILLEEIKFLRKKLDQAERRIYLAGI